MTDDFGACVVAIPYDVDLPIQVEGGPHITLAYFGDTSLGNNLADELAAIVSDVANSWEEDTAVVFTDELEWFGDDGDARVITFEREDNPLVELRQRLLDWLTPQLEDIWAASQTYPQFRPHMTLGYKSEGYTETEEPVIPESIDIRALALWNGEDRIEFELPQAFMAHYGVLRRSGRYPWGSGETPHQRNRDFLSTISQQRKEGFSDTDIARSHGMTTTQLRAALAIANTEQRQASQAQALRLKDSGMSNVAIGKEMGINESSVRALLDPAARERANILETTAQGLKDQIAEKGVIDIGTGAESYLHISRDKLDVAVAMLREEGYAYHKVQVEQLGTGNKTTVKVLAPEGTTYRDIVMDPSQIKSVTAFSDDGGRTPNLGIDPPLPVDPKRVKVRYAEEGGADADGVIYVRPGVDDLSLGGSRYAQVRVQVGDGHYLKGMAMYKDDLPDGVDLMFNTNKSDTGNKLDAMKPLKDDPENPFGTFVRQLPSVDANGKRIPGKPRSAMNIVNEEADWDEWSRSLASQMLSKQPLSLAKKQLGLKLASKQQEFDEIMALTNPAVKKKLLESFADGADASAVHLKAAPLPGQKTHVILPFDSVKETEIYAPNYQNGDRVALVRYPHGGTFEIPELVVNNRNAAARKALGPHATSAVGINAKVAQRLSGADFDGDTVLVIPNNTGAVKSSPPLQGLKNFDPQTAYKGYPGMKRMTSRQTQTEMGKVSNLITDMTIRGASQSELARAVRHSMVVIDAEKHGLDWKRSAADNGIAALKERYQGRSDAGASTLISRAKSEARVPKRKPRPASEGGPIDPKTGKKVYVETGEGYTDKKGRFHPRIEKSTKMAETDDAFTLSSGTPMETVYAQHANGMKALANRARKAIISTPSIRYSPSAKKAYAPQVAELNAALNRALKNKPLERLAQIQANATFAQKKAANPDMERSEEKKIKGLALTEARARVGAQKTPIVITPQQWEAIQAGAISQNKLSQILDNADLDVVKSLATPRTATVMTKSTLTRAKSMLASGYTQAEIASALGIPTSTLNDGLRREG